MRTLQEAFSQFEYPGRFIIIGQTNGKLVGIYGVTARSAASKAKQYVYLPETKTIGIIATDEEVLNQGNTDLLLYNAFHFYDNGIVIGNGRQSDLVNLQGGQNASEMLNRDLKQMSYEPDAHNTPRITGCLLWNIPNPSIGLHIIRANQELSPTRDSYSLPIKEGAGYLITTYAGPNIRPTPSFAGTPIEVELPQVPVKELTCELWELLKPTGEDSDLRVSLMAAQVQNGIIEQEIINQIA